MKNSVKAARLAILFCVVSSISVGADTVSTPVQIFGLGNLEEIAIASDRRHFVTAGQSGAFLWDFEQGTVRHRLEHGWRVTALAFSPDSRTLLSASDDRVIRAWDVETGAQVRSFEGHERGILNLAFAPDGVSFVSASADNTARVWSLDTGEQLHRVEVPGSFIHAAVFTPDGTRLVTAATSLSDKIRLWDLVSETTIRTFAEPASHVPALGFMAGGHLVSAGDDRMVRIWNVETGQEIRTLAGATHLIKYLFATTNSSLVTAGCHDGRVITWNADTGDLLHNTQGQWLMALCAVPGTNQVLTADADNVVRLRDSSTGATLRMIEGHTTSTTSGVAFSPDGRFVLSGGGEADTRLWDADNGRLLRKFTGHAGGTATAMFSSDGRRVLTTRGHPQPSAQLWNTETGQLERQFGWDSGWPTSAALSADGSRLAAGDQNGRIHLWNLATGAKVRTWSGRAAWVSAVAFSPDGKRLASGGSGFRPAVELWDLETGESLHNFELEAGSVTALDFSPSGLEVLVGWENGVVRLFDTDTGALQREIVVPAAFLQAAVFSPKGEFILTGGGWPFFTAILWDARTGQNLRTFAGHKWAVDSVAFDASGRRILTGSDAVRLWSIADVTARVQAERKPDGLELSWSLGQLQTAPSATGPWENVAYATSPWIVPRDLAAAFFRVKVAEEQ